MSEKLSLMIDLYFLCLTWLIPEHTIIPPSVVTYHSLGLSLEG